MVAAQVARRPGIVGQLIEGRIQFEGLAGQRRAQAVVQIAPHATALLLTGQHQLFPRALQSCRQSYGVCRGPGLAGDVLEQLSFFGGEGFTRRARRDDQSAHRRVLVVQGQFHNLK